MDGGKVSTLSHAPARIQVETAANGGEITVEILDGDRVIATSSGASVEFTVANARLWSAETPNLYQYRVTLKEQGRIVDEAIGNFGIRKVEWSNKGLFINGQETKLRGGCIHHDNGILRQCGGTPSTHHEGSRVQCHSQRPQPHQYCTAGCLRPLWHVRHG